MNRRGFLGSVLALAAAPAIVRADSLMKIIVPKREILLNSSYLGMDLAGLTGDIYVFSMLVKVADGSWENRVKFFEPVDGKASIKMPLPGPSTKVWGRDLRVISGNQDLDKMGHCMSITNGCIIQDPNDTPLHPGQKVSFSGWKS